jgi:anti-sigma factor RsiW
MKDRDSLLAAFVDGELTPEEAAEAEKLLASDTEARRLVEIHREANDLLRAACAEGFYSEPGQTTAPPPPSRVSLLRRRFVLASGVGIAAGVAGFILGRVWNWSTLSSRADLLDEVAGYHQVYSREPRHMVELLASQSDEITRWFGNRLQRSLVIPDLTSSGLHFAGGRMLAIDSKPVPELFYLRDGGTPVALCILLMPEGDSRSEPVRLDRRGSMRLASWQVGRYVYVVVGDLDAHQAQLIAGEVAAQIHS